MGRLKMIAEDVVSSLSGKGFIPVPKMAYIYGCDKQTMYVFVRENPDLFIHKKENKRSKFGTGNKISRITIYKVKENEE